MESRDPFEYRVVPKSNWELMRWTVTDFLRVLGYERHLKVDRRQERLLFLRVFFFNLFPLVVGGVVLLWLVGITFIAAADLPNLIYPLFDPWGVGFSKNWEQAATFGVRWICLFNFSAGFVAASLLIGLVGGLINGLVSNLGGGLKFGLQFGLFCGLVAGLAFGLVGNLMFGLRGSLLGDSGVSLAFGLATGLALSFEDVWKGGVVSMLRGGLGLGLVVGLVVGLGSGLEFGLPVGLGFGFGFALGGGFVYLMHVISGHYRPSLTSNIYLTWGSIDTSLFLEQKLICQCQAQPNTGLRFASFLWHYRPNQRNLASLLAHAATAKNGENAAIALDENKLRLLFTDQKGFQVPIHWQNQLAQAKKSLIAAETTNLIGTRVALYQDFLTALEALHKSTQQVPEKTWRDKISMTRRINWHPYYEAAVAAWLKVGREKYAELQALAALTEPIATNRYQTGGALSPAYNQAVFMSRDDLKDQLSALLYTTQNFSVFFLQGQRRVGKTSLLKFLPHILGRRFELVYLDLQGSIRSVPDFLEKWQRAFVAHFGLKDIPPLPVGDTWAATFEALHPLFSATAQERDVKIILALDEYEELHTHLAKDPEQGAAFLGAVRHFSQHQAQVSLMFVGLRFFSELQAPNWNEYFPQSVPIKVGYLDREKTFQLIEVSTLDFEEGIKEQIYELTQGHPSLIQKIGYELVQIANQSGRRHLTHTDLATALGTMVYIRDNGVTDIFWSQNCELPIDKAIVRAIVEGQPLPPKSRQRLRRLIEYGFIVEEGEGYRMRVPIFEEWVRRFGVE